MNKKINRIIAIIILVVSLLLWYIKPLGYEPLLSLFGIFLAAFTLIFSEGLSENQNNLEIQKRLLRNKEAMLSLVKSFWIDEMLYQNTQGRDPLKLELCEVVHFVDRSLSLNIVKEGQELHQDISDKDIFDLFTENNKSILILGQPGSGKTTLLIFLADKLISICENDHSNPIPVILNLSNWGKTDDKLENWVLNELKLRYNVPLKVGSLWIKNEDLILLLDGFDEMPKEFQSSCIDAVNVFRKTHGFFGLAICSRSEDYENNKNRLFLQNAFLIKPLSSQQIENYLLGFGTETKAVRMTLKHDQILQSLAETPLMLDIMITAYKGLSIDDLRLLGSVEDRRSHILKFYIDRMFKRRTKINFSDEDSVKWLIWLAKNLKRTSQSIFNFDMIQPNWLETKKQLLGYAFVSRLATGFTIGFAIGLQISFLFELIIPLSSPNTYIFDLFLMVFTLPVLFLFSITFGLIFGLIGTIIGGVFSIFSWKRIANDNIEIIESLKWSWTPVRIEVKKIFKRFFNNLKNPGALNGDIFALYKLILDLLNSLKVGLLGVVKKDKTSIANGLLQSVKNGFSAGIIGFFYGIIYMGVIALIRNLFYLPAYHLEDFQLLLIGYFIPVILLGVTFGGISFFRYGFSAFLKHLSLRLVFLIFFRIPWNFKTFLDYACDLILMKKAGGGYIFIHRILLDYFSELEGK